jgi:uncharacterized protein (DUF1697 family)
MAAALGTYVVLLRAINVGGRNIVPMADLVSVCEAAGHRSVRTYIQSGNLILRSRAAAEEVERDLARRIEARFGFAVPVVARSATDIATLGARNPFLAAGAPPERLHVAFLARAPSEDAVAALDPRRSPGDRFAVIGREMFLELPNGVGRSKLTNDWIDRSLKTVSTVRSWRTVTKLDALARELSAP